MTNARPVALLYWPASILTILFLTSGCLDPRAEDDPGYSHRIWPEGRAARPLESDERLLTTVTGADGFPEDRMPLHSGFLNGEAVSYWDFGEVDSGAGPAWIFRKRGEDEDALGDAVGHPAMVDTAPGDDDYGPLRSIWVVYVTDRYRGEVIPSFAALEDAVELGLVEEPVSTGMVVAWPMARPGAELELHDGETGEPTEVLYRGHLIPCFTLESFTPELGEVMLRRGSAPAKSAYVLRRQSETQTIDELSAGADLNDDGDMVDTNLVFTAGPEDKGYTGLVSLVEVTVNNTYEFGDARDEQALFSRTESGVEAVLDTVVEYSESGDTLFRPILPVP